MPYSDIDGAVSSDGSQGDDACVCPFCGSGIPPENIDVDEWTGIADAVCPRCGRGYNWLA